MLKQHVYSAGNAKTSRRKRVKRAIRQPATYTAAYVKALKTHNRIYLAIMTVKAIAIILLAMGGYCE